MKIIIFCFSSLYSHLPTSPAHVVYTSQIIRYSIDCSWYLDFVKRYLCLNKWAWILSNNISSFITKQNYRNSYQRPIWWIFFLYLIKMVLSYRFYIMTLCIFPFTFDFWLYFSLSSIMFILVVWILARYCINTSHNHFITLSVLSVGSDLDTCFKFCLHFVYPGMYALLIDTLYFINKVYILYDRYYQQQNMFYRQKPFSGRVIYM